MNDWFEDLKRTSKENPALAIGAIAAAISAVAKLVDAVGRYQGSRGYAKDADRRYRQYNGGPDYKPRRKK